VLLSRRLIRNRSRCGPEGQPPNPRLRGRLTLDSSPYRATQARTGISMPHATQDDFFLLFSPHPHPLILTLQASGLQALRPFDSLVLLPFGLLPSGPQAPQWLWSFGALVSFGVSILWCSGALVLWCSGALVLWCSGFQVVLWFSGLSVPS
jgi:hypothetical protein